MELAFESKELRSICEQESIAKEALDTDIAEALKYRLADLRAATSINDLIVGRPRILKVDHVSHLVIDLSNVIRMVLQANHPQNPLTDSGELDWSKVSRIKVIYIGDEYDK